MQIYDADIMKQMRVAAEDGCKISVCRRGDHLPLHVFIHGSGENSHVWTDFISRIPDKSVALVDLRGHGMSDWDSRGIYRDDIYAQDVVRVLNSLGAARSIIVGHSLGAAIAIRVASIDRRIQKLIVVDYGLGTNPDGLAYAGARFRATLRSYESPAEYVDTIAEERSLLPPDRMYEFACAALRRRADGKYEPKCDPILASQENDKNVPDDVLHAQLRAIHCATLIVRGSCSAIFPLASAQRTAKTLKNAEVRNVPMAGHAVMWDNPQGFADVVLPFLTGP